jgi:hypothetical protein
VIYLRGESEPDPDRWRPIGADQVFGPPQVGAIIGWRYGVWCITEVTVRADHDLTDEDVRKLRGFKPDYRDRHRPYHVVLAHVSGPLLAERPQTLHDGTRTVHLGIPVGSGQRWSVLPERYPACSCHGHPWPCQDHDFDQAAAIAAKRMDRELASAQPGVCSGCLEPITTRQKTITYPGESLTVPGAESPRFHLRRDCHYAAEKYEAKWLAVDPRRERILTWPDCGATLIVHHDGTSECAGLDLPSPFDGLVPRGYRAEGCGGHSTHDHRSAAACFAATREPCPRGCPREGHPGAAPRDRQERAPKGQGALL